jgi:c-di-GMP-specific phosphodiesterase
LSEAPVLVEGDVRFGWDAAELLEAMGAGHIALWSWEPGRDRLRISGAVRRLGLGPLGHECGAAALRALAHAQDTEIVDGFLQVRAAGVDVSARLRMRGGPPCVWRGVWLEDGVRAAGAVAAEARYGAADQDRLTGLLDRAGFLAQAREAMHQPHAYELVVADLNRLRRLNEALGHERADLVLAALAARLAAAFPPEALPARVGEDEFAVLLPRRAGGEGATQALRAALEQPLRVAGFDIFPTMAVGAVEAEGGPDAPEAAELLRRAELAVEAAKGGGAGAAANYGRALETDSLSRLAMEADLRTALHRREIEAFYQPVVRLETGAVAGFEALVRWRHPRRGLTAPDDFLPLAAEMGMMPEIGRFMLRAAAQQLGAWRDKHVGARSIWISINLSPGEVDRLGLVEDIAELTETHQLPKGALKLEITETDIMQDPDGAAETLKAIRAAGASIALDDFGTGFSSLSYLTRLPFDTLKIDRYFVRTMAANEGSTKIVRSVVALGRDLQLEVVAEGVENAMMARTLLDLGCHYGQGFGYAPALNATDAEVYLTESLLDGAAPVKTSG